MAESNLQQTMTNDMPEENGALTNLFCRLRQLEECPVAAAADRRRSPGAVSDPIRWAQGETTEKFLTKEPGAFSGRSPSHSIRAMATCSGQVAIARVLLRGKRVKNGAVELAASAERGGKENANNRGCRAGRYANLGERWRQW